MKKKVSLKDIAEKVGVSIALVSYVLNDKKQDRISKAVAQKIKDMAAELNYKANHIARSLKTKKTYTIGLIVADISNSFSSTLARIIENECEKFNYSVVFGSADENHVRQEKLVNIFINHQLDGLIIAPCENGDTALHLLLENEIPFVLIDRYIPGFPSSYVAIDNYQAAFNLTQHLVQNQRKRIGLITYQTTLANLLDRRRGYFDCLQQNNLFTGDHLIKEVGLIDTAEATQQAIDELLTGPEPIDAIVFSSNTLSTHGLKHINNLSIDVPRQLAIAAFDESDAAELFRSPVTHIKQPLQRMGEIATELLMQRINGQTEHEQHILEAIMVVRASSGTL